MPGWQRRAEAEQVFEAELEAGALADHPYKPAVPPCVVQFAFDEDKYIFQRLLEPKNGVPREAGRPDGLGRWFEENGDFEASPIRCSDVKAARAFMNDRMDKLYLATHLCTKTFPRWRGTPAARAAELKAAELAAELRDKYGGARERCRQDMKICRVCRHFVHGARVEELLARLRSAPVAVVGELESDARRAAVLGLVSALRPIVEQIRQLTSQIAGAVREHPDGPTFLSLFRDPKSVICAAGLLAEIGDNRARYPTRDSLAADAGMAPVAIESGKRRNAAFRWACDKRLRSHICVLADSTRHWHPGPATSTSARAPAAATTPTPSASSAAPGAASSGAAGKTTPPTTRSSTERQRATSRQEVDTGRLTTPSCWSGCSRGSRTSRTTSTRSPRAWWHMLNTGEIDRGQGPAVISERDADNARGRAIRQLERLGHQVILQPLPEAA